LAKELLDILKPFKVATDQIQAQYYVSASYVAILYFRLLHLLNSFDPKEPAIVELKNFLIKDFRQRNHPINQYLWFATIVDPRFKQLSDMERIRQTVFDDFETYLKSFSKDPKSNTASNLSSTNEKSSINDESDSSILWGKRITQGKKSIKQELDAYLWNSQELEVSQNPLQWWKVNENYYPQIAELARRFLSIPATSAPAERIFSLSGQIISERRRSHLDADVVDKLIFLKVNMKKIQTLR